MSAESTLLAVQESMLRGFLLKAIGRLQPVKALGSCTALLTAVTATLTLTAASAQASKGTSKSYAVFLAAYSKSTGQARGGVAGTAFFVSPGRALTAFHVLQAASFQPRNSDERVQIWLVHEGEPAIELAPGEINGQRDRDLTTIRLSHGKRAPKRHVFELSKSTSSARTGAIRTEGFLANSTGPVLQTSGDRLEITAVPLLRRLTRQGGLAGETRVNLTSHDVNLQAIPCLQLDYQPVVGLSGGPVVASDGKVVGMNSFADPRDRATTWAIALPELSISN